jgi:hypothetical protein
MAVSLKHSKVSAKSDGLDTSLVLPSDWNAEHAITMATGRILGRTSSGTGAVEELSDADVKTFLDVSQAGVSEKYSDGNDHTLVLTDRGKTIEMTDNSSNTVTIPTNSSVAFPTGTVIWVVQSGSGQTSIAPASGVTLRSRSSMRKISAQYGVVRLWKEDTNTWILSGDIAA